MPTAASCQKRRFAIRPSCSPNAMARARATAVLSRERHRRSPAGARETCCCVRRLDAGLLRRHKAHVAAGDLQHSRGTGFESGRLAAVRRRSLANSCASTGAMPPAARSSSRSPSISARAGQSRVSTTTASCGSPRIRSCSSLAAHCAIRADARPRRYYASIRESPNPRMAGTTCASPRSTQTTARRCPRAPRPRRGTTNSSSARCSTKRCSFANRTRDSPNARARLAPGRIARQRHHQLAGALLVHARDARVAPATHAHGRSLGAGAVPVGRMGGRARRQQPVPARPGRGSAGAGAGPACCRARCRRSSWWSLVPGAIRGAARRGADALHAAQRTEMGSLPDSWQKGSDLIVYEGDQLRAERSDPFAARGNRGMSPSFRSAAAPARRRRTIPGSPRAPPRSLPWRVRSRTCPRSPSC